MPDIKNSNERNDAFFTKIIKRVKDRHESFRKLSKKEKLDTVSEFL
jgi:hypothetical protein